MMLKLMNVKLPRLPRPGRFEVCCRAARLEFSNALYAPFAGMIALVGTFVLDQPLNPNDLGFLVEGVTWNEVRAGVIAGMGLFCVSYLASTGSYSLKCAQVFWMNEEINKLESSELLENDQTAQRNLANLKLDRDAMEKICRERGVFRRVAGWLGDVIKERAGA